MDTPPSIVSILAGLEVLVIDDAPEMRDSYPRWLRAAGAACTVACTLQQARRLLKRTEWDALVLDKRLPDGDAHEELLTEPNRELPRAIVAVSGHFTAETELLAQIAGAVILRKPFGLNDLLHAIELAVRRVGARARESGTFTLAADAWRITPDGATLEGPELSVKLTPRERDILVVLWRHHDVWVGTRALAEEVLGRIDVSSLDTIRSHVRRLRNKLGRHGALLESDRRFGYRWARASASDASRLHDIVTMK